MSQSGRPARLDGRLFMASFVTTTEKKTTNNRSDSHRRQSSLVRYVKLDRSILKDLSLDPDKISFHSSVSFCELLVFRTAAIMVFRGYCRND